MPFLSFLVKGFTQKVPLVIGLNAFRVFLIDGATNSKEFGGEVVELTAFKKDDVILGGCKLRLET